MDKEIIYSPYFEFLRFALDESLPLPKSFENLDIQEFFEFAKKQSLLGVFYQGVSRFPKGVVTDIVTIAKWTAVAQRIRQTNRLIDQRCVELQQKLQRGTFRSCILKGQGIARLYPDPTLRNPGDIDVWVAPAVIYGDDYPHRVTITKYVDRITPGQKVRYHHIDCPCFDDVEVEVHFTPSYMYNPLANHRLQRWFERNADLQYSNKVALAEEGAVSVPTISFNLVYILSHLYRHVFSEGIGLRQLLDYYYVLINSSEDERKVAQRDIALLGMKKFAGAVMWVMQEVFGLRAEYLLFTPDEQEGRFLLDEVLIGGNFGHYDNRLGDKSKESFVWKHIRMTVRNMRLVKHYPSEALCEPVFRFVQAVCNK